MVATGQGTSKRSNQPTSGSDDVEVSNIVSAVAQGSLGAQLVANSIDPQDSVKDSPVALSQVPANKFALSNLRVLRFLWPRRDRYWADKVFYWAVLSGALGVSALLLAIGIFLTRAAWPAIETFGIGFFLSENWDPVFEDFGALPVIFGTVVSSLLAMMMATPLSIGVALFLNEMAPRRVSRVVGFLIEMLAAIPSVVYGLWGIFLLAPWVRTSFQPVVQSFLGKVPFFSGPPYGVGMFTASLILAIMVTPTVSSICREVFRAIPRSNREAAMALGATRWETMRIAVLSTARSGIVGATILGLGRAIGETMAVTMVIGNRAEISASVFSPAQTMASVIANEYAEATTRLHLAALAEVGLALFAVTFVMNGLARLLVRQVHGGAG